MKKLMFVLGLVTLAGCGSGVDANSGEAACATASACGIIAGGISQCTFSIEQVNDPTTAAAVKVNAAQVNCIAHAGSNCDAARACLNGGKTPTACTGSSQSCSGNVWNSCDSLNGTNGNNGTRQFDCASSGEQCITANGNTDCGAGTCDGFVTQCNGNVLKTCANGIEHDLNCASSGSTCEPSGITAHCRGKGATCTVPLGSAALRCDGKSLVSCVDGQEASQDCGEFNLGCFGPPPGGSGYSCALGSDCTAASDTPTCQGNVIHYCNKGKFDTYDCGAHGFVGCMADALNGGRCIPKTQ